MSFVGKNLMLKKFLLIYLLVSSQYIHAKAPVFHSASIAEIISAGHDPAIQLNEWYNNKTPDCGDKNKPAYQCSGIMIRNTSNENGFNAWDPSPQSEISGGISFSWIRTDFSFYRPYVNTHHGYILYPQSEVNETLLEPRVLCGFPYDADTWKRNPVCGKHRTDKTGVSAPCETLNVNDEMSWLSNFLDGGNKRLLQCGFNFEEGQSNRANRLKALIRVHFFLEQSNSELRGRNNEFIIQAWPKGIGEKLPIHSFYYDAAREETLKYAQRDQLKYYNLYGKIIPIVAMKSPKDMFDHNFFTYSKSDQKI